MVSLRPLCLERSPALLGISMVAGVGPLTAGGVRTSETGGRKLLDGVRLDPYGRFTNLGIVLWDKEIKESAG